MLIVLVNRFVVSDKYVVINQLDFLDIALFTKSAMAMITQRHKKYIINSIIICLWILCQLLCQAYAKNQNLNTST
jgi:hypothetical protein